MIRSLTCRQRLLQACEPQSESHDPVAGGAVLTSDPVWRFRQQMFEQSQQQEFQLQELMLRAELHNTDAMNDIRMLLEDTLAMYTCSLEEQVWRRPMVSLCLSGPSGCADSFSVHRWLLWKAGRR